MQNRYCDLMEREDAQIFSAFNENLKWFNQLIYNKRGSVIDAFGIDKKNRKCHIEIKQRTGKYEDFSTFLDNFETIYLDYGKMNMFSNIMMESGATLNEQELFVSIFNKGEIILIHNLLKPQPTLHMPLQRVYNPAKKQWEIEHKVGLYWHQAIIYEKQTDGNYKKWTDEDIMQIMDKQKKYSKLYN